MAEQKKERVLMFSSREICYLSSNFFANQLGAAFEELGFEADICELSEGEDFDERLRPYIGKKYRVIVDFNSLLPKLVMEDDSFYIDALDGPFFDYILDHPLFHHNSLVSTAENFHALTLDEGQKEYVEQYYPHIKSVHMLPLGATEAFYRGDKEKAQHVLFLGTYDSPDTVYELVKASPEPLRKVMDTLLERRLADPLLPMEQAFRQYLFEQGAELKREQFALFMNAMYPVDAFIRDYFRKAALDDLLSHGIPVKVSGEGWEKYCTVWETRFTRENPVTFAISFERIAREQILLNSAPIFNRGMHDRIPAGMANRAAVLTDQNPYLDRQFLGKEALVMYSAKKPGDVSECAGRLMEDAGFRERIQENAFVEFQERHTWKHRAVQLLALADEAAEGCAF